jgi:hypothetical protein
VFSDSKPDESTAVTYHYPLGYNVLFVSEEVRLTPEGKPRGVLLEYL